MNALDDNRYTQAWAAFGSAVPQPTAILAISAHWYINATAVTAMAQPKTIHDFYGFPERLFAVDYPAPGDPELAAEITDLVRPTWIGQDHDSWGIDHGSWSVLVHAFPAADIPVVQLSINAAETLDYHIELGRRIAPLRERGVLIVTSGNLVHNLHRVAWDQPGGGYDWAERFEGRVIEVMLTGPTSLASLVDDDDYALAVPTPDHFLPLAYLAGLADAAGDTAEVLVRGCAMGSLSMACFTLGCRALAISDVPGDPPPVLPDLPADETNL
jgi:4,5-DOPA dioxygenase extradiol